MSVLVSRRRESKLEVLIHAVRLQQEFTKLLQRNFGIRDINTIVRRKYAFGKEKTENCEKYICLMVKYKDQVNRVVTELNVNLRSANSIYPTTIDEYRLRRTYQTTAIGNCEQLICLLQLVVDIFEVDLNIYNNYIKMLDKEILLIKGWRQKDNKMRKTLG